MRFFNIFRSIDPRISAQNSDGNLLQFYIEDYKLKVGYLTDHFSRMWTRFNFFITIETAIIGSSAYLGFFQRSNGSPANNIPYILVAILGAILSLFWYLFGVQDRYVAAVYRKEIECTLAVIKKELQKDGISEDYYFVGQTEGIEIEENWLYQWRYKHISTTKLAAYFPLAIFFIWADILIYLSLQSVVVWFNPPG